MSAPTVLKGGLDVKGGLLLDGAAMTRTAAQLNNAGAIGTSAATVDAIALHAAGIAGTPVVADERTFTETAAAGTYTGSVVLPAGATLLDIIVSGVALWDNAGAVDMDVGDAATPNGYFAGIDLKAVDLLAGESISFANAGGLAGAYIANDQVSPVYSAAERTISGIIVSAGAGGGAGRTRMLVVYVVPAGTDSTAATKA